MQQRNRAWWYVVTSLPKLPFTEGPFSLALVSHCLFLSSEQFDPDLHIAAFDELLWMVGELRVFSLLDLERRWSSHFGSVREYLKRTGFEVVAVEYEFQRAEDHAGNRMMRVRSAGPQRLDLSDKVKR
jgi:hypothetical protein